MAVCQLAADSPVPSWALAGGFFSVTRSADELSIVCQEHVCEERVCQEQLVPADVRVELGWVALKLEGPFPFSMTGVLASFLEPLTEAEIPIFAISTFDTDYVLIKRENLEQAVRALQVAGHHQFSPVQHLSLIHI